MIKHPKKERLLLYIYIYMGLFETNYKSGKLVYKYFKNMTKKTWFEKIKLKKQKKYKFCWVVSCINSSFIGNYVCSELRNSSWIVDCVHLWGLGDKLFLKLFYFFISIRLLCHEIIEEVFLHRSDLSVFLYPINVKAAKTNSPIFLW